MEIQALDKLGRDIIKTVNLLNKDEVRFLVDNYYIMQENRIRAYGQERALEKAHEEHAIITYLAESSATLELTIKKVLAKYTDLLPIGQWAKSIVGIGPVITAGLYAHIDITRAPTAGHIWSYAGLNPDQVWEKGKKRPWNASVKVLTFKLGESFVKFQNHEQDVYGRFYREYKAYITEKNERGDYRQECLEGYKTNTGVQRPPYIERVRRSTQAYKSYKEGKLSQGHIHSRARRHAAKIFLSHWHEVAYFLAYGQLAPIPYAIAHLGHAHIIEVPNIELIPGLQEAKAQRGPIIPTFERTNQDIDFGDLPEWD